MKKLKVYSSLFISLMPVLFLSNPATAIISDCRKTSGTIAHLVTWDRYEQITFAYTNWLTNAEGPNAPYPGIEAFSITPTSTPDPVAHLLVNWAPGSWQLTGDSSNFSIINTNPVQIISNPFPGGCIDDFVLP